MVISSATGKARWFNGKEWSAWMDRDDAQAQEDHHWYGSTRPRIILRADAKRFGIAPARAVNSRKGKNAR